MPKSASLRNLVAQLLSDNASFLIVSFYSMGALSSRRKHCFRVGVARLSGVELPGFSGPVVCESQSQIQLSRQLHPGWLTRPSEVQEGLACANCMASARGSDAFAWHPRPSGIRAGFRAWLRLPLLVPLRGTRARPEQKLERGCSSSSGTKVATFQHKYSKGNTLWQLQLKGPKCVSFTTHVLKSCDFRGGAAKVYFLYYTCTDKLRPSSRAAKVYLLVEKLRLSSRSCQSVFPLLHLY